MSDRAQEWQIKSQGKGAGQMAKQVAGIQSLSAAGPQRKRLGRLFVSDLRQICKRARQGRSEPTRQKNPDIDRPGLIFGRFGKRGERVSSSRLTRLAG